MTSFADSDPADLSHYCGRCLESATPRLPRCTACGTPFSGAGFYDLIAGARPSREFAYLFRRPEPDVPRRGA